MAFEPASPIRGARILRLDSWEGIGKVYKMACEKGMQFVLLNNKITQPFKINVVICPFAGIEELHQKTGKSRMRNMSIINFDWEVNPISGIKNFN